MGLSESVRRIGVEPNNLLADTTGFTLPVGWAWASLSELGRFASGKTPSKGKAEYWNGTIPWVSPKDMKSPRLTDSEDHVSEKAVNDGLAIVPESSLLIVVRSGILRRTVPVAITAMPCTVNQDLKALTLKDPTMAAYVQLLIGGFESFILSNLTKIGTTVESMKFDEFSGCRFPLPPLAEQHRIVARVEELMTLCDELEARGRLADEQHARLTTTLFDALTASDSAQTLADNWQRIATHFDLLLDRPQAIDALEQTILQLAVRGLLVPQDASDEPASKLLEHIHAENPKLSPSNAQIATDTENPLPATWKWTSLDSIAVVGTGTTPTRTNPLYFDPPSIPWVTSGETRALFISRAERGVSPLALRETSLTIYPPGTLVVAMYGQGKTRGQISELLIEATTNQACAAIRLALSDVAHRKYIKLFFEKIYDEIREKSAGGAQPNLNVGKIKATAIPLPPLAEQHRIVSRVEKLRSLCDDLREELNKVRATQIHLVEALVTEAVQPPRGARLD